MDNIDDIDLPETETVKGGKNFWTSLFRTILGITISMKLMHSDRVRNALNGIHNRRCWLRYAAATLRFFNLQNMAAIGISEHEVMEFTNVREEEDENTGTPPDVNAFYTDAFTLDSLTTLTHLTERIEELKAGKE